MRVRVWIVGAFFGAALLIGASIVRRELRAYLPPPPADTHELFATVVDFVTHTYVDSTAGERAYLMAVEGLLGELGDPRATFLPPERLSRVAERQDRVHNGLGIEFDIRDGELRVVSVRRASPAHEAGLQSGDAVIQIDDRKPANWTVEDAEDALRVVPGTRVRLTVVRPGIGSELQFRPESKARDTKTVALVALLADQIGYIGLSGIGDSTPAELRREIGELRRQRVGVLVIDLRDARSGLLEEGAAVADLFLDRGQRIVSAEGRRPEETRQIADTAAQPWPDLPLILLVNERSARAAELLAGALQDHDRALLVGTATSGEANTQTVIGLNGGSALRLTTAIWFTPVGRQIERRAGRGGRGGSGDTVGAYLSDAGRVVSGGGGIAPDVAVRRTRPSPEELAFQRALGGDLPAFHEEVMAFVDVIDAGHRIVNAGPVLSPAILNELWTRFARRHPTVPRAVYDSAAAYVSSVLGARVAARSLGARAEFELGARYDVQLQSAIGMASGALTQAQLFANATARGRGPAPR